MEMDATNEQKTYFSVQQFDEPLLMNPLPLTQTNLRWYQDYTIWIGMFCGFAFLSFIVAVFYFKHRIKRMRNKKAFIMSNPLILLVSIGEYSVPDEDENE